MHYNDLVQQTGSLSPGRHTIYELPEGKIVIRNMGIRHAALADKPEYRMLIIMDSRELQPRHSDFFSDYLLKVETRPDLHLPLTEACEQLCNGVSPQGLLTSKRLPRLFAEASDKTWSFQKQQDQIGGLPTELFLCGLQGLIRVYDLNGTLENPRETFRKAFLGLEKGQPLVEMVKPLEPAVMSGKYYFNSAAKSR